MDAITTKITYISSAVTVWFAFLNDNAAAIGALVAIASFMFNMWFKLKILHDNKNNSPD